MLHLIPTVKREEWPLAYPILPKEKKSSWVLFYLFILINLRTSSHPFDWKMPRGKKEHLDKGKRKRKIKNNCCRCCFARTIPGKKEPLGQLICLKLLLSICKDKRKVGIIVFRALPKNKNKF